MVTYEFMYKEGDEGFYRYYVEGHKDKENCGIVAIKEKGKGRIVELAPEDEFKNYAYHVIYDIRNIEGSGTVAWY